jgi:hypothetical protein
MQAAETPALAPPTRAGRAGRAAGRLLGRLDLLTARIPPWAVLGPLVVVGWLVVLFVARAAVHTGWLYYNGGDGTWYYTTGWVLAHGHIPYASIGYAYPMLLAPLARIAGPNMLAGLPYAIAVNTIVLGPLALVCIYGIAKQIAGRRFAYLASIVWVIAPLLAIPYFDPRYHRRYVGETLPAVLGLTTLGDFPSMVVLLVSAYFTLRAISTGRGTDALTAGLAAGLALGIKPANATFLPALVLGLAFARRLRPLVLALVGLVPSVLCLAIWKDRGIGTLPLFSLPSRTLALGPANEPLGLTVHLSHYIRFSWHTLTQNIDGIREYTWSKRLIEWSIVAGAIALFRRSIPLAVMVISWFAAYLVIKGGTITSFTGGNFFRYMSPAFPAVFLLALSVPLLLPIAGRKLAASGTTATWPLTERARRRVVGVTAFCCVAPLVPLVAFPEQTGPIASTFPFQSLFVPTDRFEVHAKVVGGVVRLTWAGQSAHGAKVNYDVFRAPTDVLSCQSTSGGSTLCSNPIDPIEQVSVNHAADVPGGGDWVYRVAAVSGVPPPSGEGDAILYSSPVGVHLIGGGRYRVG